MKWNQGDGRSWVHLGVTVVTTSEGLKQVMMWHVVSGTYQMVALHDGFQRPSTSLSINLYTMTTANPSHNFLRHSEGRHAQAVRRASDSQFPDDLPARHDDEESIDGDESSKIKKEARRRVRQQMPPMPDLRFEQVSFGWHCQLGRWTAPDEQSYLLSIRPFLTPRPTKKAIAERGQVGEDNEGGEGDRHKTMEATEDDEVFHWGREVDVKWGMLTWVTFRDQVRFFSFCPSCRDWQYNQCGS